jgi:hypothetical protein
VIRLARPRRRPDGTLPRSPLRERLETELHVRELSRQSEPDPATALRETVEAIWKTVEHVAREGGLQGSRPDVDALLARRELVHCATRKLSAVIRRGVASGAFRPASPSWAIRRLPFALIAGACAGWVFGLSPRPAVRAGTAVAAALDVL